MRQILSALLLLPLSTLGSPPPQTLPLWPNGAPGPRTAAPPEGDTTTPKDHRVAGRPVIRLGNVTDPSLTVYLPASPSPARSAVLVFPGGGYRILAIDLEGSEVCQWLNSIGVVAILVKYRVPQPNDSGKRYTAPLADAERAMSLVRQNAHKWNIDGRRIGVLGFSAGGHLAAALGEAAARERTYPRVDDADRGSLRPDFTILIYPAYLSVNDAGEEIAPEVKPSAGAPPAFLVQAENDHAFIDGTLLYYRALKQAGVPAEMHLFATGGHGFGLRPSSDAVTGWPALCATWLHGLNVL